MSFRIEGDVHWEKDEKKRPFPHHKNSENIKRKGQKRIERAKNKMFQNEKTAKHLIHRLTPQLKKVTTCDSR